MSGAAPDVISNGYDHESDQSAKTVTDVLPVDDLNCMVEAQDAVTRAPWEVELMKRPASGSGVEVVSDLRAWLNKHTNFGSTWKWTHMTMRDDLEASQNIQPVRFYLCPSTSSLFSAWHFSSVMVGHPEIVHGGAAAFAFDETFGILFASLNLGRGFTANLTINYRQPLRASTTACLCASLDRREGRKVYLTGSIRDSPDGKLYSEATALFIIAKD